MHWLIGVCICVSGAGLKLLCGRKKKKKEVGNTKKTKRQQEPMVPLAQGMD
jgi:hypothetical protein